MRETTNMEFKPGQNSTSKGRRRKSLVLFLCVALAAVILLHNSFSSGQSPPLAERGDSGESPPLPFEVKESISWRCMSASAKVTGNNEIQLTIDVRLQRGWKLYAIDQKPFLCDGQPAGGPLAAKVEVASVDWIKSVGEFEPTSQPATTRIESIWPGLDLRTHHESVVWKGALQLQDNVQVVGKTITGFVTMQVETKGDSQMLKKPFIAVVEAL
jgi:hypothetical protein